MIQNIKNHLFSEKNLKIKLTVHLSLLVIISLLSFYLINRNMNRMRYDSLLIHVSGRQRMLSQKYSKEIIMALSQKILNNEQGFYRSVANAEEIKNFYEENHKAITQNGKIRIGAGYEDLSKYENFKYIDNYNQIESEWEKLKNLCVTCYDIKDNKKAEILIEKIRLNSDKLLGSFDIVSNLIQKESSLNLTILSYNLIILLAFLIVLIIILFFLINFYIINPLKKRKAEAEFLSNEAQKANFAKSRFLSTMSHEMRTPLNSIIGGIDLLEKDKLSNFQKKITDIIKHSSKSLLFLINDILDFTKIEKEKMELEKTEFNLDNLIVELIETFQFEAARKELEIKYIPDLTVPEFLIGDPYRLSQILRNLISNGIKFTMKGGIFITVKLLETIDKKILLQFEIKDTGIGIPEDKVEKLFKSFTQLDESTTRKFGGTGLGLSISKELIALMGGSIKVDSKEKKGSIFTFTSLFNITSYDKRKINEKYENKTSVNNEKKLKLDKKYKVLVVEDNSVNQVIIKQYLKKNNFRVKIANNGKEALTLLKNYEFDIVLLDCEMPVMDGFDTAKNIRKINSQIKNIPIIAVTASTEESEKQKCFDAGMDDFIQKPIDFELLISRTHYWIDLRRSA
ncbi:MAG: response regulator [Spirochaetia bacterium]|nr:response regulator [Spirochaetia bacterium]